MLDRHWPPIPYLLTAHVHATWLSQLIDDILELSPDGPPSEMMEILDKLH